MLAPSLCLDSSALSGVSVLSGTSKARAVEAQRTQSKRRGRPCPVFDCAADASTMLSTSLLCSGCSPQTGTPVTGTPGTVTSKTHNRDRARFHRHPQLLQPLPDRRDRDPLTLSQLLALHQHQRQIRIRWDGRAVGVKQIEIQISVGLLTRSIPSQARSYPGTQNHLCCEA